MLFEILDDDDLVLMADSIEDLRMNVDKWKSAIEKKELKVNLGVKLRDRKRTGKMMLMLRLCVKCLDIVTLVGQ